MSLPGPSSHGRIAACPTSETLPHVRSSSEHSRRGEIIHAFLKACATVGRDAALLAVEPEDYDAVGAIDLSRLPPLDPGHYVPEVSFALHLAKGTCREVGRGLTREEARAKAQPGEMIGTADLVGLTERSVVLFDWKSGRGHVDRADVNWQTRDYSLMAARAYKRDHVIGAIVRVLDDGAVWYDYFEMDALDLDAHEAELRALMEQRERLMALPRDAKRPDLHEGPHCRYCPALPHCPAKMTLLTTTFAQGEPLAVAVSGLTAPRAGAAWTKIEQAKKLLERLEAILKDYGRQNPFPTTEGYEVSEVTENKETIVADRARPALERHFGEQLGGVVFSQSVEQKTSLTKSALSSNLRKYVLPTIPKGKITHIEKDTLEALRKAGAISVASYKHVKEHKAKDEEPKKLPEKTDAQKWDALTPEGRIDYGRGATAEEAAANDDARRKARDERIRACELSAKGHNYSRMGRCFECNAPRPAEVSP